MSAPFFPPPQKKESAPFRTAAVVAPAPRPVPVRRPELLEVAPPVKKALAAEVAAAPEESFLSRFLWRFGVRVVSLGIVMGLLYGLVWAHEAGAKWPQVAIVALGAIGILASPFILFWRLRRIWRFLFARDDGG